MAELRIDRFVILLLAAISTTLRCGVMPAVKTRNYTVTDFALPVAMAYSTATDIQSWVSGTATNEVFDVLESQGRGALVPDAVISTILSQLSVTVSYTPLMCPKVHLSIPDAMTKLENMQSGCIIAGNTVSGICTAMAAAQLCMANNRQATIAGDPDTRRTISGSLSTTNIIMANWPRAMWQSVLNRALRTLALGQFGSHLITETATVGGD